MACVAQDAAAPVHLTLPQAIDMAMKQNRDVKLDKLGIADAKQKKDIARSSYFPKIANDSKMTYITELAGVAIPAGAFGDFSTTGKVPGKTLFLDQGSSLSYTSGTNLDQPATQLFRIHEANRAAQADVRMADIDLERGQDDVTLKTRELYDQVLIAQQKIEAAKQEIVARTVKDDEARHDVERGNALTEAAMESHAAFLEAKQDELEAELTLHGLMLSLADLLGLPVHTPLVLDPETAMVDVPLPSREECLRIAEAGSPELRLAEQAIEKARAGLAAAKDAYIPDVTGIAHYSYQSGVPLLVHNFGIFGFSLQYDLFDGGKRESQVRDARTELEMSELSRQKLEDEITVQLEQAYDKVDQWREMTRAAEAVMTARAEAARLSDREFEQSEVLPSATSEAHAQEAGSRAQLLAAQLSLSMAEAEVRRIIGAPRL
ncbi:TolC family protein [Silvibacterium dinghuense]|nr:TolC family protein [Silvibacterium dinghuense]